MKASKVEQEFQKLASQVVDNGGVLTVSMRRLRDCFGVGRLGQHVLRGIEKELKIAGLGLGTALSDQQWDSVRLFKRGHPVEDLMEAFFNADVNSPEHDKLIINASSFFMQSELVNAVSDIKDIVSGIKLPDEDL